MEQLQVPSSSSTITNSTRPQHLMPAERRIRPQKEHALNCPRCNSTNTKFCYYNNYSLTQPRYFCKTCRRYWTEGGSLRNVPVGGGSRKNKKSTTSVVTTSSSSSLTTTTTSLPSAAASSSKKLITDQNPKFQESQDLNLAFPMPEFGNHHHSANNPSAMELLRSTGMNPFMPMHPMPMPMPEYSSGFGVVQDLRANSLSFPLDGMNGGLQEGSGGGGRILFPFEESRAPASSSGGADQFEQNKGMSPGFWNGMMGGGGGGGGGSW